MISNEITAAQIDRWEHACLLYRSYDWMTAVEIFSELASSIRDGAERQRCMLNKGLLQARLGALPEACDTVKSALSLVTGLACSYYILAQLEAELGNIVEAQACFEICLKKLEKGRSRDEWRLGFVPDLADIRENISACWEHVRKHHASSEDQGSGVGLHRLPAEYLFEPPSRPASVESSQAKSNPETSRRRRLEKRPRAISTGSSIYSRSEPRVSHQVNTGNIPRKPLPPLPVQSSAWSTKRRNSEPTVSAQVKFKPKLTARDARVQIDSTKELARFIRHSGPGTNHDYIFDREYVVRLLQGGSSHPSTDLLDDRSMKQEKRADEEKDRKPRPTAKMIGKMERLEVPGNSTTLPRTSALPSSLKRTGVRSYGALLPSHPCLEQSRSPDPKSDTLPKSALDRSIHKAAKNAPLPPIPSEILQHAVERRRKRDQAQQDKPRASRKTTSKPSMRVSCAKPLPSLPLLPQRPRLVTFEDKDEATLDSLRTISSREIFKFGLRER